MKKLSVSLKESRFVDLINKKFTGEIRKEDLIGNLQKLKPVDIGTSVLWADNDLCDGSEYLFTFDELTDMYRQIISKTGISPDKYIDYDLANQIPELIDTFKNSSDQLYTIARTITEISGEKSSESASLETMAMQLRKFIKKPRTIQRNLRQFSDNISSLGTWILTVSQQSLHIDYLVVHSDDYKLPKANPNFFGGTWFGVKAFFKSFF